MTPEQAAAELGEDVIQIAQGSMDRMKKLRAQCLAADIPVLLRNDNCRGKS